MSKSITHFLSQNLENLGSGEPVVLFLHGYGADETDLPDITSHLPKLAWVSPRAPLSSGSFGFAWYEITPEDYTPQAGVEKATTKLWEWIDKTLPESSPLIPIGFSQGALMASQLLRTRPKRILKTVLMAGFILPEAQQEDEELLSLKPKVLYCHGDADNRITQEMVEFATGWLSEHTSLQNKTYSGLGHNVDNRVINDVTDFLGK